MHRDLIDLSKISALIFRSALFNNGAVFYVRVRRLNILVWWLKHFISWWVGAGQSVKCMYVLTEFVNSYLRRIRAHCCHFSPAGVSQLKHLHIRVLNSKWNHMANLNHHYWPALALWKNIRQGSKQFLDQDSEIKIPAGWLLYYTVLLCWYTLVSQTHSLQTQYSS